jgi:hypothetical protein
VERESPTNYCGAKFTVSPAANALPPPPRHWIEPSSSPVLDKLFESAYAASLPSASSSSASSFVDEPRHRSGQESAEQTPIVVRLDSTLAKLFGVAAITTSPTCSAEVRALAQASMIAQETTKVSA